MFTPRQLQLLAALIGRPDGAGIAVLACILDVSDKTVKKEIRIINSRLPEGQRLAYRPGSGYTLEDLHDTTLTAIARAVDQARGKETHRSGSILVTLLFEKDYITMEAVGRRLYLSKSAIRKEFEAWWRLREYIEVSHQKGLRICVPESEQRYLLAKFFARDNDLPAQVGRQAEFDCLAAAARFIAESGFRQYNLIVSGASLQDFYTYLAVSILRSRSGFIIEPARDGRHLPQGISGQSLTLLGYLKRAVRRDLDYTLTDDELYYCRQQLEELNPVYAKTADPAETGTAGDIGRKICTAFLDQVRTTLRIEISLPKIRRDAFALHLQKAEIRIADNHQLSNLYKREQNRKYPLTAHLAAEYLHPLLNPAIEDAEFSLLIPYFAAAESFREPLPGILVSRLHPGPLHHLTMELEQALSGEVRDILIVPPYQYQELSREFRCRPHLLFTTEHEILLKHQEALYLPQVLDPDEIRDISLKVRGHLESVRAAGRQMACRRYLSDSIYYDDTGVYQNMEQFLSHHQIAPVSYAYELVLDVDIAFFPCFAAGCGANEVQVYVLRTPFRHRGRIVEMVISAVCDPDLGDTHAFYDALRSLISPQARKKAVHFFSD